VQLLEDKELAKLARGGQYSAGTHCSLRNDETEFLLEGEAVFVAGIVIFIITFIAAVVHYCDTCSGFCAT